MTHRIFKSICTVALLVLLATVIAAVPIALGYCTETLKNELELEANYIEKSISVGGTELLEQLFDEGKTRVTLIAPDGAILFDSEADISGMDNHLDRDEIAEAIENGEGYSVRYSDTLSLRTVNYARRLADGSVLRVSGDAVSGLKLLSGFTPVALIILICAVGVGILFAFHSSKKIVEGAELLVSDDVDESELYQELVPVFRRLVEQRRVISKQMDEIKLRRQELEAITENMADGLIIIDERTNIISCNKSALKILNADLAEFTAPSANISVLKLDQSKGFRDAIRSALLGKRVEKLHRTEEKIYRMIADPVMDDGTVSGVAILILDETEKERREELRREFTSNVSHELKTPLTSISGFAELIRSGLSGDNTVHFADNIYREAQRLISLVNDIIKLSKLDENAVELKLETISLKGICDDVASRLANVAEGRGISVSVSGDDAEVLTDAKLLEEVIYNLCDNSVKYGRDGGYVKMNVHMRDNGSTVLTVDDDGIGIPGDQLDRIFERFYRVDKSHSKDIGGTGLGLSIVKHSVSRLGIELSVSSSVGVGTRMTLVFSEPLNTDLT